MEVELLILERSEASTAAGTLMTRRRISTEEPLLSNKELSH